MIRSTQTTQSLVTRVDDRAVLVWLWSVYAMVFAMVVIGGITRLTGSGLSMVEWRPLMGALPPLSTSDWLEVFSKYKATPQYQLVNSWMDLAAFKQIFFWEYVHRLFGRLIGLVVLLPWLYFIRQGRMSKKTSAGALIAIVLGGAQGALGWYMVKSGLVNEPAVSHFRLAAHLLLALFVSQWLLWLILNVSAPWRGAVALGGPSRSLPLFLLGLLYAQIAFGAFVAGKRAGFMSSTFPDMNGHYLPSYFFRPGSFVYDLFNHPLSIHYAHRAIGTLVLCSFVGAAWLLSRETNDPWSRRLGIALGLAVLMQFLLGVMTVVLVVPTSWAVTHQAGAVILLGITTALLHRGFYAGERPGAAALSPSI